LSRVLERTQSTLSRTQIGLEFKLYAPAVRIMKARLPANAGHPTMKAHTILLDDES
jgi:hypothetical protein